MVGDGIVPDGDERRSGGSGNMVNSLLRPGSGNCKLRSMLDHVRGRRNRAVDNGAYGNKYGYDDGEAFDSDMMNVDNIFQYNLSHD